MTVLPRGGFSPPPYPFDRLSGLAEIAGSAPGGMVDLSVGTPTDPMPDVVVAALCDAAPSGVGYPPSIGTRAFREAACGWMARRLGVTVHVDDVIACVGTKELVASLPHVLHLRDPGRDVVLYPAISYPTYAMGATLGGCTPVPVPLTSDWHLDLARVDEGVAERALLLWVNEPGNPTGALSTPDELREVVAWARARGIVVASDECYVELTYDAAGMPAPPVTALVAGDEGVLVVHSLSKRSNMAGIRAGFVAGDPGLVHYLGEVRKHAGLMLPGPVQAAAAAALADDEHVEVQRARYAERRAVALGMLGGVGLVHDGGPATFYLWARAAASDEDGWAITERLARGGMLVAPGDLYGEGGSGHVRLALVQPADRIERAFDRVAAMHRAGSARGGEGT